MSRSKFGRVTFRMTRDNLETLSSMIDLDEQSENREVRRIAHIVQRAIQKELAALRGRP